MPKSKPRRGQSAAAEQPAPPRGRGRPRKPLDMRQENAVIGQRIRAAREAAGLSVDEAAARTGVASRTWYSWESGVGADWIATAGKMLDVLGVPLATILTGAK